MLFGDDEAASGSDLVPGESMSLSLSGRPKALAAHFEKFGRKYCVTLPVVCPAISGTPPGKERGSARKKQRKRASRAAAIDAVKQALREHLRAARDHAYSLREHGKKAELLPRPTQQLLADQLRLGASAVSRAINDPSDKEIKILWKIANDLEHVLQFKG
jgi:hypothetical protein